MKQFYTAKEIAEALALSHSTIVRRAEREGWEAQKRIGKGGGYEYHISNLPTAARRTLEAQQATDLLPTVTRSVINVCGTGSYTDRQREAADARATIIRAIDDMTKQGVTQKAAMTTVLTQAETGALETINPVLDKALRMAKDSRGRSESAYPSVTCHHSAKSSHPADAANWLSPNGPRPFFAATNAPKSQQSSMPIAIL